MNVDEIKKIVANLPSFITDGDIECYHKYARLINNGLIVDLGTGWGKSMLALIYANPNNIICTCDPGNALIDNGWVVNADDYQKRINDLITEHFLGELVKFYLTTAEGFLSEFQEETIDLLHMDSWVEIRNVDSVGLLKEWIKRVKSGGYLLIRNYGYADRQPFTDSVDGAMVGLKKIETMGLITIWQK